MQYMLKPQEIYVHSFSNKAVPVQNHRWLTDVHKAAYCNCHRQTNFYDVMNNNKLSVKKDLN